jgi:non-lysosomal glucosylceramidase
MMVSRAVSGLALIALALPGAGQEATMPAQNLVPADKGFSSQQIAALLSRGEQRIYVGQARTTIGMPCGGICAGQLYVLGDGTLGCWQIDGSSYFTGTGQTSYRTYRPDRPIAQGFAIAARGSDGRVRRATLDDAGYDAIEFVGEYPRALIRYRGGIKEPPPVQVDLEVFSPFIPLQARDSAWPATVLRFTVTNPTDQEQEVALGGWLENMVCRERTNAITIRRRNQAVGGDGLTTVLMDVV